MQQHDYGKQYTRYKRLYPYIFFHFCPLLEIPVLRQSWKQRPGKLESISNRHNYNRHKGTIFPAQRKNQPPTFVGLPVNEPKPTPI